MELVLQLTLLGVVLSLVAAQLQSVPRFWAFVFLFLILFPKISLFAIPGNSTPLRVDDLVLALVLGGWLIRVALLPRIDQPPVSPITPFLLLYLSSTAVSTLLGIAAERVTAATGALHFLRFVEYSLVYYYFFRTIHPGEYRAAKAVFVNTWLIVAGIWIVQHWIYTKAGGLIDTSTFFPSFSATYDFGGYAMISTAFCYAIWTDRKSRDRPATIGLLVGLYIAFNGDSRASLLGLAFAIVFDLALRIRVKMALGVAAVVAVVPYIISTSKMAQLLRTAGEFMRTLDIDTLRTAFFNDPSIAVRLQNWQLALEHWQARPVFGDGLGAFLTYVRIYDVQGTPDGWYIRVVAETGIVGLLSFMMLLGCLMFVLLKAYRELDRPLPRVIVYAGVLGLLATSVNALLIDTFVSYKIMSVFWMLMALGTRLAVAPNEAADAFESARASDAGGPMSGTLGLDRPPVRGAS